MNKANFNFLLLVNIILVIPVFSQKIEDAKKNVFIPQGKTLLSHLIQIEKQKNQYDSIKIKNRKINYKYGDTSNDIIAIKKKADIIGRYQAIFYQ